MIFGSIIIWLASPSPSPDIDPNTVTPTWVGFAVTFFVAVASVLLILDMSRRIRRVRYREEIRGHLGDDPQPGDTEPGDTEPGGTLPGGTGQKGPNAKHSKPKN